MLFGSGFCVPLDKIHTRTSVEIQAQAVTDLIGRLLPGRANEFDVKVEPGLPGEENGYFQVVVVYFTLRLSFAFDTAYTL